MGSPFRRAGIALLPLTLVLTLVLTSVLMLILMV